jgi:N6-L-threonylcarbamoyladenine synthase
MLGRKVLSNIIATQSVHEKYGGVVPELAGRAHQSNIVPVVAQALSQAGISVGDLHAVAVTVGPGLMGSLHVGVAFAKSLAMALHIPLLGINHMEAHIMAHFIDSTTEQAAPQLPMLCLTVSGGHTQLVHVDSDLQMRVIGATIDDAAGEAFDKAAKVLGLPYPGGPLIDRLAESGDSHKFAFAVPKRNGLNYSFSGLKTSLLYFLRDRMKEDASFIANELPHIAASYRHAIVSYLMVVLKDALPRAPYKSLALAGGVSANRELRRRMQAFAEKEGVPVFIPPLEYCTDNAAMIGIAAYYKYKLGEWSTGSMVPLPALKMKS